MSKNGHPIRVLVVDDSAFIRNRNSMTHMKCSDLQLVGTAMNGHDAIEQAKRTQPDVMTLDIEMPSMNGLGSIRSYDGPSPTSSIIVGALTEEGAGVMLQALGRGAVDFMEYGIVIWHWGRPLRRAL